MRRAAGDTTLTIITRIGMFIIIPTAALTIGMTAGIGVQDTECRNTIV